MLADEVIVEVNRIVLSFFKVYRNFAYAGFMSGSEIWKENLKILTRGRLEKTRREISLSKKKLLLKKLKKIAAFNT